MLTSRSSTFWMLIATVLLALILVGGCQGMAEATSRRIFSPSVQPVVDEPKNGVATLLPSPPRPTSVPTLTPFLLFAVLSEVRGGVEIRSGETDGFVSAIDGDMIYVGGQARTLDDGYVRLDLSGGAIVRLAPQSSFTLVAEESAPQGVLRRVWLEIGKLWVILTDGYLAVRTPSGQAAVRGSYMGVSVDPATLSVRVTCLEGACEAVTPAGTLPLSTGQAATILPPSLTGGDWQLPFPDLITDEEIQEWLDFNPEAGALLPRIRATLEALPTREPLLDSPNFLNVTPPGILPNRDGGLRDRDGGFGGGSRRDR